MSQNKDLVYIYTVLQSFTVHTTVSIDTHSMRERGNSLMIA